MSPLTQFLPERTAPEYLYLQTKWAAVMSYGRTVDFLEEVFPLKKRISTATLSGHIRQVATRVDCELGDEQSSFIEGCPFEWEKLPPPAEPLVMGIDCGYVHAREGENRKAGSFEIIVGKSMMREKRFVMEGEYRRQIVLYVVSCGSPIAQHMPKFVTQAQDVYWRVCVITTPHRTRFLDIPSLERMTSYPVRSHYKQPDEPNILPRADALVAFPATFNTLNKWALGITDTLAVGLLCEYTGLKVPIIAVPITGEGLRYHPAFARSD